MEQLLLSARVGSFILYLCLAVLQPVAVRVNMAILSAGHARRGAGLAHVLHLLPAMAGPMRMCWMHARSGQAANSRCGARAALVLWAAAVTAATGLVSSGSQSALTLNRWGFAAECLECWAGLFVFGVLGWHKCVC